MKSFQKIRPLIVMSAAICLFLSSFAPAQLAFHTFDDASSAADFTVVDSGVTNSANFALEFGYDYSVLSFTSFTGSVPEAPNTPSGAAASRGLVMQSNLIDEVGGQNVYTTQTLSGNFSVQVDFFDYYDGGGGSTENPTLGILHGGTEYCGRVGDEDTRASDGYFFNCLGDIDGIGDDYYFHEGSPTGVLDQNNMPGFSWADGEQPGDPTRDAGVGTFFTDLLPDSVSATGASLPGAMLNNWTTLRMDYAYGTVSLYFDDQLVASYSDPDSTYTTGKVLLGFEDLFGSVSTNHRGIFDNLIITEIVAPAASTDWMHFE